MSCISSASLTVWKYNFQLISNTLIQFLKKNGKLCSKEDLLQEKLIKNEFVIKTEQFA